MELSQHWLIFITPLIAFVVRTTQMAVSITLQKLVGVAQRVYFKIIIWKEFVSQLCFSVPKLAVNNIMGLVLFCPHALEWIFYIA